MLYSRPCLSRLLLGRSIPEIEDARGYGFSETLCLDKLPTCKGKPTIQQNERGAGSGLGPGVLTLDPTLDKNAASGRGHKCAS